MSKSLRTVSRIIPHFRRSGWQRTSPQIGYPKGQSDLAGSGPCFRVYDFAQKSHIQKSTSKIGRMPMVIVLLISLLLFMPQNAVHAGEIPKRDIINLPVPNSCGKFNAKAKLYLQRLGVITLRAEFCYQQDCELVAQHMNKVERANWFCREKIIEKKGDIDGSGLECKYKSGEIEYLIFEKGETFKYDVSALFVPPKIVSYSLGKYHTEVSYIGWGFPSKYTKNRKTLEIQSMKIEDEGVKAKCKLMAPEEIKGILLIKVDSLNKLMKRNKL